MSLNSTHFSLPVVCCGVNAGERWNSECAKTFWQKNKNVVVFFFFLSVNNYRSHSGGQRMRRRFTLKICKSKEPDLLSCCFSDSKMHRIVLHYYRIRRNRYISKWRIVWYRAESDAARPLVSPDSFKMLSDSHDWKPSQTSSSPLHSSPDRCQTMLMRWPTQLSFQSGLFFRSRDFFTVLFTLSKAGSP